MAEASTDKTPSLEELARKAKELADAIRVNEALPWEIWDRAELLASVLSLAANPGAGVTRG